MRSFSHFTFFFFCYNSIKTISSKVSIRIDTSRLSSTIASHSHAHTHSCVRACCVKSELSLSFSLFLRSSGFISLHGKHFLTQNNTRGGGGGGGARRRYAAWKAPSPTDYETNYQHEWWHGRGIADNRRGTRV